MCLAIPAKILKTDGKEALADFGGVERRIRIDLVNAKIGDYVIVHTGYAIQKIDKDEAIESLGYFKEIMENAEF